MNDKKKSQNEQERKRKKKQQREVGSVKEVRAGRPSLGRQASGSKKKISGIVC